MTKYSENRRSVEGRPKTRSQNPMGNAPWGQELPDMTVVILFGVTGPT